MPMFLFSGAFFPISQLGDFAWIAYLTPIWHGVDLTRMLTTGTGRALAGARSHRATCWRGRSSAGSTPSAASAGGCRNDHDPGTAGHARSARAAHLRRAPLARRRAQLHGLPTRLGRLRHRHARADPLPVLDRHRRRRAGGGLHACATARRVGLRRLRRAGHAGHLGHERRALRCDVQHLLQDEVRQAVRRDARHSADAARRGARGDHLGAAAWRAATRRSSSW